jgi:outer membrane protein OmpA-like peptidoglycan-associated protein
MKLRFFLFIFAVFIFGCASKPYPVKAIFYSEFTPKQLNAFKKCGVQVIQLGDELRFVLSTRQLFINNTAKLKTFADNSFDEIIHLLNQRKNVGVLVLVYTPSLEDFKPNVDLAQQQAQTIVEYLLQRGLKARLIVASAWQGVSTKQKSGTGSFNDDAPGAFSVEIRTRFLHSVDYQ